MFSGDGAGVSLGATMVLSAVAWTSGLLFGLYLRPRGATVAPKRRRRRSGYFVEEGGRPRGGASLLRWAGPASAVLLLCLLAGSLIVAVGSGHMLGRSSPDIAGLPKAH